MNIYRSLSRCTLMLGILAVSFDSSAHTLKQTNARVILRDGQVEVRIIADMVRWKNLLQDEKAWLMADIDTVMPKDLPAEQQTVFLTKLLENHTNAVLNRQRVALTVASSFKSTDGHSTEIILRGKHQISKVAKVSISFPKSLGAVYTSFVKPQYKMLAAGRSAVAVF